MKDDIITTLTHLADLIDRLILQVFLSKRCQIATQSRHFDLKTHFRILPGSLDDRQRAAVILEQETGLPRRAPNCLVHTITPHELS